MTITYYRKDDRLLLNENGDEFLGAPESLPNATLVFTLGDHRVSDILAGPWLKMGVRPIKTTLEELETMGGVFLEAAQYIKFTTKNL